MELDGPVELAAPRPARKREPSPDGTAQPQHYGGFRGLGGEKEATFREKRRKVEAAMPESRVTHIDPIAVRCAEAPFGAWAAQKEKRVATAFGRIIERDWYDKQELTMRPVERVHLNAVREHFAMRRDKIQTPDFRARPKSNTLTRQSWAESLEAMEVLNRETHVATFFHGLVGRTIQKRLHKQAKLDAEAAKKAADRAAKVSASIF